MTWKIKKFHELTPSELYEILKARCEVFIMEQSCPYLDEDGYDASATHLFADDEGKIAAYCRLFHAGIKFPDASIGRVITTSAYRGTGLGRELMNRAIRFVTEDMNEPAIRISGQAYLRKFYESLGFEVVSEEYLEDGIPHYEMYRST